MKANTVFAVTMGKMSKVDTNSAAIAANAEEIAEVREIAEGATAGAPIPKSLASEMVEGGVYLYTGSETGYNAGHVYYYVGGVLTDGGQYGGIAIDDTLTSPIMAAPASEVGQIKEDLSAEKKVIDDNLFVVVNPLNPYSAYNGTGKRINADGIIVADANYNTYRYTFSELSVLKIVSDDKFIFQNASTRPSSAPNNYLVGGVHGAFNGIMTIPYYFSFPGK